VSPTPLYTIKEIAEELGIKPDAAKQRLHYWQIKPSDHSGKTNLYDPSVIDELRSKGRDR